MGNLVEVHAEPKCSHIADWTKIKDVSTYIQKIIITWEVIARFF